MAKFHEIRFDKRHYRNDLKVALEVGTIVDSCLAFLRDHLQDAQRMSHFVRAKLLDILLDEVHPYATRCEWTQIMEGCAKACEEINFVPRGDLRDRMETLGTLHFFLNNEKVGGKYQFVASRFGELFYPVGHKEAQSLSDPVFFKEAWQALRAHRPHPDVRVLL